MGISPSAPISCIRQGTHPAQISDLLCLSSLFGGTPAPAVCLLDPCNSQRASSQTAGVRVLLNKLETHIGALIYLIPTQGACLICDVQEWQMRIPPILHVAFKAYFDHSRPFRKSHADLGEKRGLLRAVEGVTCIPPHNYITNI